MEYSQLANYSEDPKVENQWDVMQALDAMEDLPNLLVLSYDKEYRNIVDINREMKQIRMKTILSNPIILKIMDTQINNII